MDCDRGTKEQVCLLHALSFPFLQRFWMPYLMTTVQEGGIRDPWMTLWSRATLLCWVRDSNSLHYVKPARFGIIFCSSYLILTNIQTDRQIKKIILRFNKNYEGNKHIREWKIIRRDANSKQVVMKGIPDEVTFDLRLEIWEAKALRRRKTFWTKKLINAITLSGKTLAMLARRKVATVAGTRDMITDSHWGKIYKKSYTVF